MWALLNAIADWMGGHALALGMAYVLVVGYIYYRKGITDSRIRTSLRGEER